MLPGTADTHWELQRDLAVRCLGDVPLDDPPRLVGEALARAEREWAEAGGETGFHSTETHN